MSAPTYPGVVPPPPGVTPDLDNPKDAGRTLLLSWLITCNALVITAFITRAYVKVWILRKVLPEDATCTIAWVLTILYSVTCALMLHYGEGRHAWEVSPEAYKQILKWLYAGSIVYCPAAYFTKVTLLLIIARIFMVRRYVTRSIYIFIAALLVAYLPMQISKTFICSPIKAYWDHSVHGSCLNQRRIFIADTTLGFLTDFIILILPIPLIWSLHAPLQKRIKIAAVLGAGGIATGVTCFRLWAVVRFIHSTDVTSDFVRQSVAVLTELSIGFICSCLPATNILLERCKSKRPSMSSNSPASNGKSPFMKHPHNSHPGSSGPSEPGASSAFSRSPLGGPPVDVDVELAMLCDQAELRVVSKNSLNSTLGRREERLASTQGDRYFMNPGTIGETYVSTEPSPTKRRSDPGMALPDGVERISLKDLHLRAC